MYFFFSYLKWIKSAIEYKEMLVMEVKSIYLCDYHQMHLSVNVNEDLMKI